MNFNQSQIYQQNFISQYMFISLIKYFIYCEIQYMSIKDFYEKICYNINHFF